jgi:hypothetical protein
MIGQLDPLAADPLARRLEHLNVVVPTAPRLSVWSRPRGRRATLRSWRGGGLAAAAAAILALTVTAATYPGGLAALTQDALRASGLTSQQLVPLSGSGATADLKVSVTGGYADEVSTVLFVSIDQTCQAAHCGGIGGPYLTDQFGTRYDIGGGEGIGVGAYPIFFQPLSGRAAVSGARLTLHLPTAGAELVVPLVGTLTPGLARHLTAPAAIVDSTANVTYEVTGLVYSGSYLEVSTRLSGQLHNVIVQYPPSGQMVSGESWPGVFLVDPSGDWGIPLATNGVRPTVNEQVQDETRIFSTVKAGTYHVVVANEGSRNVAPGPSWKILAEWTIVVS